jgi:hypothetical protein
MDSRKSNLALHRDQKEEVKRASDDERRGERERDELKREEENKKAEVLQPEIEVTERKVEETDITDSERTISDHALTIPGQSTPLSGCSGGGSARSVAGDTVVDLERGDSKEDVIYVSHIYAHSITHNANTY